MNSENFNKIQINETINTANGSLMLNIRHDELEPAIELYEGLKDCLKIDKSGEVQIIIPHSSKYYRGNNNSDYPVIEEVPIDEPFPSLKKDSKKACKLCKASMILRSGKNGQFWGCSRYNGNGGCTYTEKT